MNRDDKAKWLETELAKWMPNYHWRKEQSSMPEPAELAQQMIYRNGEPWVRVGYALREMLVAAARYVEFVDTVERIWPGDENWRDDRRGLINTQVVHAAAWLVGRRDTFDWQLLLEVLNQFQEAERPEMFGNPESEQLDDVIFQLSEYRDSRLLERFLGRQDLQQTSVPRIAYANFEMLMYQDWSEEMRIAVGWALKNYTAFEWLFPWVTTFDQQSLRDVYYPLFALRDYEAEKIMNGINPVWQSIRDQISEDFEDLGNLRAIVDRVSEVVEILGYDDFVDSVLSHGGQSGPDSMLGNTGAINLIPADGGGVCCSLVLAIAQGRHASSRRGFPQVMRQLRAHLIQCSHMTQVAVILTDTWDPKLINESKLDLLAHREQGLQVITLLASGNALTAIPLGF